MPDTHLNSDVAGTTPASGSEGDHAENVPMQGVGTDPSGVGEATVADALEQREEVPPPTGDLADLAGTPLPDDAPVADVLEQAQEVGYAEDDYR